MMAAQSGKKMIFMSMEFGQMAEWDHDAECEWHLLDKVEHQQLQACYADLNGFTYKKKHFTMIHTLEQFTVRWMIIKIQ